MPRLDCLVRSRARLTAAGPGGRASYAGPAAARPVPAALTHKCVIEYPCLALGLARLENIPYMQLI